MQWDYQENFKRTGLRTSLMFASTPTLNSAGNSSVDETASSTGSNSDYWENSSSNDQNDLVFSTGRRIFLQNPNRLKSTRKKHIRSKRTDSPETSKSRSDLDVKVTQNDLIAIDACLRGHKSRVYVCHSMANLYSSPRASTSAPSSDATTSWTLAYTGIPALILDIGNTKSRTKRQIQMVLVEKGTGFILWSDVVDNLTKYTKQSSAFHTMHVSSDHSKRIGLSFDSGEAAENFYLHLQRLTSDPANIALSGPRSFSKKSGSFGSLVDHERGGSKKYKAPNKSEISLPCAFQHVISVNSEDFKKYFSLQAFVSAKSPIPLESNFQHRRGTSNRTLNKQPAPLPPSTSTSPRRSTSLSCSNLNTRM